MKCEHEGCDGEAVLVRCIIEGKTSEAFLARIYRSPNLCRSHLAAWLREKADEVEGVSKCSVCPVRRTARIPVRGG